VTKPSASPSGAAQPAEPVAWRTTMTRGTVVLTKEHPGNLRGPNIVIEPLYLHPVEPHLGWVNDEHYAVEDGDESGGYGTPACACGRGWPCPAAPVPDRDALIEQIAAKRNDTAFMARIKGRVAEDAALLARIEQGPIPLGLYAGANRYDTDNEHVLSVWTDDGQTYDLRWPR
jgi:hypothetical protein